MLIDNKPSRDPPSPVSHNTTPNPQCHAGSYSLLLPRRELETLGLNETDLVCGIPWCVDIALRVMGIPVPEPPDYPTCLQHLLRRKIFLSTLGQVEADLAAGTYPRLFIKPALGAKGFSGTVVTGPEDGMLSGDFGLLNSEIYPLIADSGGREATVHCSEVLDMNSEYAVYVVDGTIRQVSTTYGIWSGFRGGMQGSAGDALWCLLYPRQCPFRCCLYCGGSSVL